MIKILQLATVDFPAITLSHAYYYIALCLQCMLVLGVTKISMEKVHCFGNKISLLFLSL